MNITWIRHNYVLKLWLPQELPNPSKKENHKRSGSGIGFGMRTVILVLETQRTIDSGVKATKGTEVLPSFQTRTLAYRRLRLATLAKIIFLYIMNAKYNFIFLQFVKH